MHAWLRSASHLIVQQQRRDGQIDVNRELVEMGLSAPGVRSRRRQAQVRMGSSARVSADEQAVRVTMEHPRLLTVRR